MEIGNRYEMEKNKIGEGFGINLWLFIMVDLILGIWSLRK